MKTLELKKLGVVEINKNKLHNIDGGNLWGAAKELFFGTISAIDDLGTGVINGYHDGRILRIIDESQKIA